VHLDHAIFLQIAAEEAAARCAVNDVLGDDAGAAQYERGVAVAGG